MHFIFCDIGMLLMMTKFTFLTSHPKKKKTDHYSNMKTANVPFIKVAIWFIFFKFILMVQRHPNSKLFIILDL